MMTSISGKRGIGKTYHLSKRVYEKYLQGYFIITNFSHVYSHVDCSNLEPEEFYDMLSEVLIFKDMGYEVSDLFPDFKHTGIFIAIDEGHLYFSADSWKRYQSDEQFQGIIKLLAQARKQDIEIEYTTQDPSKIDKNWRRYTEDYIRYTPVLNYSYKKLLPHKTKPIYKREMRFLVPLVWEEYHDLSSDNPMFDYSMITDENGIKSFSPHSTLIRRKMRKSGWLDPFPYRLYDSNQVLAIHRRAYEGDFSKLRNFSWIEHTFKPELLPTVKNILHMKRNDKELPIRLKFRNLALPEAPSFDVRSNVLSQPSEFIDDLHWVNTRKSRSWARRGRVALRARADANAQRLPDTSRLR